MVCLCAANSDQSDAKLPFLWIRTKMCELVKLPAAEVFKFSYDIQ